MGAEEGWLESRRLVARHTLVDRVTWLAEKADGPGFGAVLDALATHPQAMVRRRVAKHPQIPAALAAAFMQDSDRWVRASAARAFERALAVA